MTSFWKSGKCDFVFGYSLNFQSLFRLFIWKWVAFYTNLYFSNCNLTIASTQLWAHSRVACAAICTESGTFKSFAWREGDCWLMEMCPLACSFTKGDIEGWNIYCPTGKELKLLNIPILYDILISVHLKWRNESCTWKLLNRFNVLQK